MLLFTVSALLQQPPKTEPHLVCYCIRVPVWMQTDAMPPELHIKQFPSKQAQEGRLWTSSVHWHSRQKLIQTKLSTDTSPSPISMGTDTALAKTKQELLTQHTLPKTEPMQTSERKLIPVLSLLFHTELLGQSSTFPYHSNLGIKTEDSNHQKYRGWRV